MICGSPLGAVLTDIDLAVLLACRPSVNVRHANAGRQDWVQFFREVDASEADRSHRLAISYSEQLNLETSACMSNSAEIELLTAAAAE